MKNRYLLFAGPYFYPSRAWEDFVGAYDTVDAAISAVELVDDAEWHQVVDIKTMKVVAE